MEEGEFAHDLGEMGKGGISVGDGGRPYVVVHREVRQDG